MKVQNSILYVGPFRMGFQRHLFTVKGFMGTYQFPHGGARIWWFGSLVVSK